MKMQHSFFLSLASSLKTIEFTISLKMPGSTMKMCTSCRQHIRVACKMWKLCGAQQPMKKNLAKAKQKANGQWAIKLKAGGNSGKLVDAARILIHKFEMAGFHPVFFWGYGKSNTVSCDMLCGMEAVEDKEKESILSLKELYESLLKAIIARERK
ncbi:hypothetical protein AALO_G00036800, partial [Alosa alosa]